MGLTLRDGVHLQEAIQTAKEIDQKSKLCGFNQIALDQMARQCFANAVFETNVEEGLDLVEEFDAGECKQYRQTNVQDIQKGLKQSELALN